MGIEQLKQQKRWLWFILVYCLGLLLVLIGIMLWENRLYDHGVATEAYTELPSASAIYLVNLNHATTEELQELPKIGPVLAGEIIAYREANSGFSQKEELLQVKGIGRAIYEAISERVTV